MLVTTDAVVLHAFDYLESSRILRLATREAGVQSVLARGARRQKSRFGAALDLFTGGIAQIAVRPGRDLQTLTGFDTLRARHQLGAELSRFTASAALAEMTLRFVGDDPNAAAYDALVLALDAVAAAPAGRAADAALAGGWHLVAALGFSPSIDDCATCHAALQADAPAAFGHAAGGMLCGRCAAAAPAGRPVPPAARAALRDWLAGEPHATTSAPEVAAHQRLLRHFLQAHLGDGRPLPAFDVWEHQRWTNP